MRYDYECEECKILIQEARSVKTDSLKNCPVCGGEIESVFLGEAPLAFMADPRTLGSLAEKNTRKMGKYELEAGRQKHKEAEKAARIEARKEIQKKLPPGSKLAPLDAPDPWYGKLPEKLKKNTDPKREFKYIMEGK